MREGKGKEREKEERHVCVGRREGRQRQGSVSSQCPAMAGRQVWQQETSNVGDNGAMAWQATAAKVCRQAGSMCGRQLHVRMVWWGGKRVCGNGNGARDM